MKKFIFLVTILGFVGYSMASNVTNIMAKHNAELLATWVSISLVLRLGVVH